MKKKAGRPCKYGKNDRVEQIPVYLPGSKVKRLPKEKRNEWLVNAVDEKLKKEEEHVGKTKQTECTLHR
ncbi:Uncharacterised protein [uncultured archaeon]|nr:Uncharacterised protein [uncultured archaeon]